MTPPDKPSKFRIAHRLEPLVRVLRTQNVPVPESAMLIVMRIHEMMQANEATNYEKPHPGGDTA